MPTWSHSKKEVRRALDDAYAAGLVIKETDGHGHSWGCIDCPQPDCGMRMYVWSTPREEDVHARQIRRFVARHRHDAQ
jgi:hypothetical protein